MDGDEVSMGDRPDDVMAWFEEAATPYEGMELSLVTESTPSSLYYQNEITPNFEDVTGISVDFSAVAFGEMYNREVSTAVSDDPSLDVGYMEQDAAPAYAQKDWVVNLTQFRQNHPELTMPGFDHEGFTSFQNGLNFPPTPDGDMYSYQMESGIKGQVIHEDVYSEHVSEWDPNEIVTPETYRQRAETVQNNTDMAGHTQQHKGVTGCYALTETYWPLWGVYDWGLNPNEGWVALESRGGMMNSQRSIDCLKWYKQMGEEYSPGNWKSLTWSGVPDSIGGGSAASGFTYGENVQRVADQIGDNAEWGLHPATQDVQDEMEMSPEESPAPRGKAYMGYFNGAGWAVMSASEKKEAAYLYIQFMLRRDAGRKLAENTGLIIRDDSFESVKGGELDEQTSYFTRFERHQDKFAGCRVGEVQRALVNGPIFEWLHAFTADEVDAETAANEMAWATEQQLNRIGFLGSVLDEKPF